MTNNSKWPTEDLRMGWNHPEFKAGDSSFHLALAEGEEQARLERVFRTTKAEVIDFLDMECPALYVRFALTTPKGRELDDLGRVLLATKSEVTGIPAGFPWV